MVIKHINSKKEDNSVIFIATSNVGTLLYDYLLEKFIIVEGFSLVGPHRCVYDRDSVKEFYSLHEAFYTLYPDERRMLNNDNKG